MRIARVLILEDISEVAAWLQRTVSSLFPDATVDLASNLAAAVQTISHSSFDLALIDLGLPDGNGIDFIRVLRAQSPSTYCVVTTIFNDAEHIYPALRAGAHGYILKDEASDEMQRELSGILAGRPPLSASVAQRLLQHFQPLGHTVNQQVEPSEIVHLSPRETETLTLIANGYSVPDAAAAMKVSTHTAAGYVKSIYQKLQINSRAEATLKAINLGLVMPTN